MCSRIKLETKEIKVVLSTKQGKLKIKKQPTDFCYKLFAPMKKYHDCILWVGEKLSGPSYWQQGGVVCVFNVNTNQFALKFYVDRILEDADEWVLEYCLLS